MPVLQADVLYDESITRFGLDSYRVLVMPDADVLTQSVAERVRTFQQRGGIVVADDRVAPAITPDIRLTPLVRTQKADVDKAALLTLAATLRQRTGRQVRLAGRVLQPGCRSAAGHQPTLVPGSAPSADSASQVQEAVNSSTYLFLVNDRREFGHYVGQHGLVQEVGRMSETTVTLRGQPQRQCRLRPAGSSPSRFRCAKRLRMRSRQRSTGRSRSARAMAACFCPCRERSRRLVSRCRQSVSLGQSANCSIEIRDDRGTPVPAVLPLHVELRDPDGRLAEFSGHHAAIAGRLDLTFDLARNDLPGAWHLQVQDLAVGPAV